jgi:hypothetical protein
MNEKELIESIGARIFIIRGEKVMLDSHLADLYGIETKVLNQSVKRNIERFPSDFLIVPNSNELEELRSQIVTAISINDWNHMRRSTPMLFTENGIAMLSSVLRSPKAIQVNISIMRIFTKLRSFLMLEKDLRDRMSQLEIDTNKLFKLVFERLDEYETNIAPIKKQKKIGIKSD